MLAQNDALSAIPFLGSGLGYRRELKRQILASKDQIDFVEIVTDQFLNDPRGISEVEELSEFFQVIPHGVNLSIGTIGPLDKAYLQSIKRISDVSRSPYYSEHLAMTHIPGLDIGHLSPLWFTDAVLQSVIDNVLQVQDYLRKPLILENVTYPFNIPGASMIQTVFFEKLVRETGCGILLDITNVYINSVNHHFDPVVFIQQMPVEYVVQVHISGEFSEDGVLVDGHSEPVHQESWRLLTNLSDLIQVKGSILEHDSNFPTDIAGMLDQVEQARRIIRTPRASNAR
jgi:uncharacterized protein (UPF0276 family)